MTQLPLIYLQITRRRGQAKCAATVLIRTRAALIMNPQKDVGELSVTTAGVGTPAVGARVRRSQTSHLQAVRELPWRPSACLIWSTCPPRGVAKALAPPRNANNVPKNTAK